MGYYTDFEITADGNLDAIIERIEAISGYSFYDSSENGTYKSEEGYKWHECDENMKRVSRDFPLNLITVTGYGEENCDVWRAYFLNGEMQKEKAQVVFAECTLQKPKLKYTTVNVTVAGVDVPIEVEYVGHKTEDELYELAKKQLKQLL